MNRLTWISVWLPLMAVTATSASEARANSSLAIFKKKKKTEQTSPTSDYKKITGRDSVAYKGIAGIVHKDNDYYLEFPVALLKREFLVTNRLQRVPLELNEAGVNKGINYENQVVTFEWNRADKQLYLRQQRLTPLVGQHDAMAPSVRDNYINPLIAALKIEAVAADSSTVLVKVNDLFNGKKTMVNDVFNNINLGTSAVSDLSRILSIKAFDTNIVATSELTTTVREGMSKVNVTVEVSSSLTLLPERPMRGREESPKVGYFTTRRLSFGDTQQQIDTKHFITRWQLEPSDTAAYLRGEAVAPVHPIVFYIDPATPAQLQPYIRRGILDWNTAFLQAGFKDAVQVKTYTDSLAAEGNDIEHSVFTYAASAKSNAMGPSTIDPRTGQIIEADIIWWHNVVALLREWITVQTGATNPAVRRPQLPDSLMGDAARFVACHEVGHSLGLKHNMIASWHYPTDSLRSASFLTEAQGTAPSIMDYARFNYVAQPEDHTPYVSPHIGPYDRFAIEWGYRWYPDAEAEKKGLQALLDAHSTPLFKYGEEQAQREAVDPRALSEDLGNDAMKSATLGIANLKRIVPHVIEWTRTGSSAQTYEQASSLYQGVVFQWNLYLYHVMAHIGGMYLEQNQPSDGLKAFEFVEKKRQEQAVDFLIDQVLTYPAWLFDAEVGQYTFVRKSTPAGTLEQSPRAVYKNALNYIMWDLLDNKRLIRMAENEHLNGSKAFTPVELMNRLHRAVFATTLSGKPTDVMTRNLQKAFIDALITAAAEQEGVKINKMAYDDSRFMMGYRPAPLCSHPACTAASEDSERHARNIDMYSKQINRLSDALSVKRGELLAALQLLKSKRHHADEATRYHYQDLVIRIQTALGLDKN